MTTQIDLFTPTQTLELIDDRSPTDDTHSVDTLAEGKLGQPIAVPCGFRDRANNPCRRLGNWPIMMDGKQMVCRGRPMLHCDPACFNSAAIAPRYGADDDDIVWEDQTGAYEANR